MLRIMWQVLFESVRGFWHEGIYLPQCAGKLEVGSARHSGIVPSTRVRIRQSAVDGAGFVCLAGWWDILAGPGQ